MENESLFVDVQEFILKSKRFGWISKERYRAL